MRQHAAARQRVQHLRGVRAHARTGAGRQDHDRGVAMLVGHVGPLKVRANGVWPKIAPSPGLEPELSEPKSEVLPITPRRTAAAGKSIRWSACGALTTRRGKRARH